MFYELLVDILILILLRLRHPYLPFPHGLKANIALVDGGDGLGLDGLSETLNLGERMRFMLVGIEGFVREGVIGFAVSAKDVFSRTDQAHKIRTFEIGSLALMAGLPEVDGLLPLPKYLVFILQLAGDVFRCKANDVFDYVCEAAFRS